MLYSSLIAVVLMLIWSCPIHASQIRQGRETIQKMTGCFLVDYSYTETESLKKDYVRDVRVYDVNRDKSVKEWIYSEEVSPTRLRLQHVLFMSDLNGKFQSDNILKHQAEDWEFEANFLYEFSVPYTWKVMDYKGVSDLWTRRITNLDDGLRYQCAASWDFKAFYPQWSCENLAPIPGRETRDMGRKDYNSLQRLSRLIIYGNSWLERQENIKIDVQKSVKVPIAKELGKNWYVRLPHSECQPAQDFVKPRAAFWSLLRETWDEVLKGDRPFIEKTPAGEPPRFVKMSELEDRYVDKDLSDQKVRDVAKKAILTLIQDYRDQ